MNKDEEILNMPSGKEMDVLIAEKVMGEAMPIYSHDHYNILEAKYSVWEWWYCLPEWSRGDVCEWLPLPFSTDMSTAWKVVDEMKCRRWEIRMEGVPAGQMVKFYNHKHDLRDNRPYTAGPAPLAICRAALLCCIGEYDE